MKAIIQKDEREVSVENVEKPSIDDDQVLVKVTYATVCGSDVHAYYQEGYNWVTIPRIMGHEYTGTIVEIGDSVDTLSVGQRVVEKPVKTCGICARCRSGQENLCENKRLTGFHTNGGFAEYVAVDANAIHVIPDGIPSEHAVITEPLSVATRGVYDRSSVDPNDRVVVQGPGPIGVLTAMILNDMNAPVVVTGLGSDTTVRLPLLRDVGIDTCNVEANTVSDHLEATWGEPTADIIFDTTGNHLAIESAINYVSPGGEIIELGLPSNPVELDMSPLVRNEVDVITSYSATWPNFAQATRLLERGAIDVDALVERYQINNVEQALEDAFEGRTCKPIFSL